MFRQVENSVTRTQAMRQLQKDTATRIKECESGAKPHGIIDVPEEPTCIGSKFDNEIFLTSQKKAYKTRQQKKGVT